MVKPRSLVATRAARKSQSSSRLVSSSSSSPMNRRSNSSSSMVRKLRKRPHSATTTATTATTTPTTPTTPTTEGEDYEEQQVSSPEAPITAPQMSGSMVVFPVGPQLRKHLTCRLCSGYFREPVTITECLHTFCKSCLYFAFSQGYSQCPTCKVDLGTYPFRSTLADRTLQELVDKVLFPELKEADDEKERQFYKKRGIPLKDEFRDKEEAANDDNDDDYDDDDDDDGYGKSDKQGRDGGSSRLGAALPVAATPNSAEGNNLGGDEGPAKDDEAYTDKGKASSGKASASSSVDDDVEVLLVPDSEVDESDMIPALDRPRLRTSGRLKILQLKRYLTRKMNVQGVEANMIEIICNGVVLGNELSLTFIDRTVWFDKHSTMEFIYRLAEEA